MGCLLGLCFNFIQAGAFLLVGLLAGSENAIDKQAFAARRKCRADKLSEKFADTLLVIACVDVSMGCLGMFPYEYC